MKKTMTLRNVLSVSNKAVLTVLLLSTISIGVMAQRNLDPKTLEAIKIRKIGFLTDQLNLTPAEAEKFWPLYNELEKKKIALENKKRELEELVTEPKPGLTAADYRKLAIELATTHVTEGKLIEEYNLKMMDVIPAEKVVRIYASERKFRTTLMREFRKNQQDKKESETK
jgi:Spy/CpxP family protein refolding chaperone